MSDTKEEIQVCQHEGCQNTDVTSCSLDWNDENVEIYYYCSEHAKIEGFCPSCGYFWAGIESFDFNLNGMGVCDNCADEIRAETDDYDYDDYYGDYDDYDEEDY